MNLIGRYDKIRWVSARSQELSPPYILDRGRAQDRPTFKPAGGCEWWKSPDGRWIPLVSGGALYGLRTPTMVLVSGGDSNTWTFTSIALSSAYTSGSAGAAIGYRWSVPGSMTLTDLYYNITSYNGTAASVADINYEIRTGTISGPTTAGGGLVASGSQNPSSATGWIKIATGLSVSLSAGYIYLIIADANGGGTNFANVLQRYANVAIYPTSLHAAFSTANGWSTPTFAATSVPTIVAAFSSGNPIGSSITAQSTVTNNTARRGLYIDALLNSLTVYAWTVSTGNANLSGIELYPGSSTPGTGALATSTTLIGTTLASGAILATPYTLAPATAYRMVFTFSGNTTVGRKLAIGTGTDGNLRKAMPHGGGNWYYAYANGTTDWSNDDINAYPDMAFAIDDQVAPAAAGGLLLNPGMDGGMA